MNKTVKHPAKYTDVLIPVMAKMLGKSTTVLDPFGGTGKVFKLYDFNPSIQHIAAIEIEPEWATIDKRMILGDALYLPFVDNSFDAICTSPTYGNRMAGKMSKDIDKGKWHRIKYADSLHRNLSKNNSANFEWGKNYRDFHVKAWEEARRVLRNKGIFVLNIKNHIRSGKEEDVTGWHIQTLRSLGFRVIRKVPVAVPSMRFGKGREKRTDHEFVIKFSLNKI